MSNTLTKLSARVQVGETRVWVPGTSGNPAYCIDVQTTVPTGVWIYDPGNPTTGRPPGYVFLNTGTRTVTTQQCFPATEGTQGHYDSTPNYGVDYQLGWNAAARSIDSLTADGIYQFSVPASVVGVVTGLNSLDEGASYAEIEHALYCHSGNFQVLEHGDAKTGSRSYTTSDVFTIARVGSQVRYYQGSTLIYVSATLSTATVFADASLYAAGDQIVNAVITATTTGFLPASTPPVFAGDPSTETRVSGVLRGLTGFAADSGDAYVGAGPAPGIDGITSPVDQTTGDWTGRIGGTLRMLTGSAEGNFYGSYNEGSVTESPVPGDAGTGPADPLTGDWAGRVGGTLRMLTGSAFGSEGDGTHYAIADGRLTGLSGGGDAGTLVPEFVIVDAVLAELQGFSTALPGTAGSVDHGYLHGLVGFASDSDGAYVGTGPGPGIPGSSEPADPLTGDWVGRSGGVLRSLTGLAFDESWLAAGYENSGFLILPSLRMAGFGYSPTIAGPDGFPRVGYGFEGEIPALTLEGYGAGWTGANLRLPKLRLAVTGTITIIGGLAAELPKLELAVTGTYTIIGATSAHMRLPALEMLAYGVGGGAEFGTAAGAMALPALSLTGSATAAGVGSAAMALPALELHATAVQTLVARFAAELPALRMVSGGVLAVTLPALTMRALATVDVELAYEAYNFTLMPQDDGEIGVAGSRFTDHPFERIVRFMNHYYGVGADGIFLLEGDDFGGTPIVAVVETGSEDFDRGNLKRLEAVWFAGRCGADMMVSALSAEAEEFDYSYAPDKVGARTQRVEFGRGTEARYWAVRFTNPRGEDFEIEQLTPEITVLKRTHGGPS